MGSEMVKPKVTFANELRFTPYAWAKLLWMRDRGDTEVAGYGITGTSDPLLVTDFRLIKQECTSVTFDLDPNDGAEFMELMMDEGFMPWQYSNILIHTHPGNCPRPSGVDEDNFKSAFSHPNWAIMFIIAEGGASYCRVKINVGPGSVQEVNVSIDWKTPFGGTNSQSWDDEYKDKVSEQVSKFLMTGKEGITATQAASFPNHSDPLWYCSQENKWMPEEEAQQEEFDRICEIEDEEFEDIDCHWDENGLVAYWCDDENVWYAYNPINKKWLVSDWDDDSNEFMSETDPPDETWVDKVMEWAEKYAHERALAMET